MLHLSSWIGWECPNPLHNLLQKLWAESGVRCARYGCIALVALGVLAIFFCPLPSGSFQATHGPATALRASRAVLLILLAVAIAGLLLPFVLASLLLVLVLCRAFHEVECGHDPLGHAGDPVGVPCFLRC